MIYSLLYIARFPQTLLYLRRPNGQIQLIGLLEDKSQWVITMESIYLWYSFPKRLTKAS